MISDHFGYKNLKVYKQSYQLALDIFHVSKSFPVNERYSLVDQIRRSSRSICTNIAEAYRKRRYPRNFISKITDADGECSETIIWLEFAKDFGYLDEVVYMDFISRYAKVGKMLGSMIRYPEKFRPRS